MSFVTPLGVFQSTYLYKVRPITKTSGKTSLSFNPRTYIRYDASYLSCCCTPFSFNPRTYIRYDPGLDTPVREDLVSIHVPI